MTKSRRRPCALLESLETRLLFSTTPALFQPLLPLPYDTGVSRSDQITSFNNASPDHALNFVAAGGATDASFFLYDNGTLINTKTPSPGAFLSAIATDGHSTIADGVHVFTVRQQAPGQDLSDPSPGLTVTIDTNPPILPSAPPPILLTPDTDDGIKGDNVTSRNTPDFALPIYPGVYEKITLEAPNAFSFYFNNGLYSSDPLSDGLHTFDVQYTDAAGNVAATDTFQVDITPFFPGAPRTTSTILALTTNPSTGGAPFVFSAAVHVDTGLPPDADVIFVDNGKYLATGHLADGLATFRTSYLAPGIHHFSATVLSTPTSTASTSAVKTVTIVDHPATGTVDIRAASRISGTASDPEALATGANTYVRIDIDNQIAAVVALDHDNHRFSYAPSHLTLGAHLVKVYAYNYPAPTLTLIAAFTLVNRPPAIAANLFAFTTLLGAAIDPDAPTASVRILLYLDARPPILLTANQGIRGLDGTHYYLYALPTLPHGVHNLSIYGIDSSGANPALGRTLTFTT